MHHHKIAPPFQGAQPKALFFDVFGTCVDWRKTVTDALYNRAQEALNSSTPSLSGQAYTKATAMTKEDWGELAQDWRNTYLVFTRAIASDPDIPYKTVDQHHLDALVELLEAEHLASLWNEQQVLELSKIWHYLDPWVDTPHGIRELNKKFNTCTLSNGNVSLLEDMVKHGGMPFTHIYSAEMFNSYKPSPKVYLGAAEKMGIKPEECVMVAAHLDDLKAAKSLGFRTVYVERSLEERHPELRDEQGIVDVWVTEGEDGFIAAAEKLGIEVQR
ncbi:uncharacterized protein MYCFIDRAFT_55964 [Pseudocercospora fijiensis CIRAD86]|uniref:Haloacid dehalogenase n=1 Tax=Pseudocercospora fijiensis (strain CIRAD86) TaxID=383855 RepID=M3AU35_PSEFD|nr:uncharacterized protein MYCFIDRAFT_55964 [Pseudocercospora fijiensis CIRAD86]EME81002.1 hypothetical protein MYCFIDRAFT_55964 [Pseudocercospora fijiensis CIRAD86]